MRAEAPARTGRVLLLAGTAEARALAARAGGLDVVARLAGRTEAPASLGVPTERGGFGGEAGARAALDGVAAVLDATHPFAVAISARTARLCAEREVPYLRYARPPFVRAPGWRVHAEAEAAAAALPQGARVLLAAGPGSLAPFLGRGLTLWCRRVDPAPAVAGVEWITGLPGDAAAEADLLRDLGVTHLVAKDSGGARGKLDAAGALGLAVHLIARPPAPPGAETHDLEAAWRFLEAHAHHQDP